MQHHFQLYLERTQVLLAIEPTKSDMATKTHIDDEYGCLTIYLSVHDNNLPQKLLFKLIAVS